MTIGTAIVVVMCLYLLDKHGLLKRAVGVLGILSVLALAWIFGQQQYQKWQHARYARHHAEMQASLISKYHGAVPAPPSQPPNANIPTLDPSQVEFEDTSKVIYLDAICREPQWSELSDWERSDVLMAVTPKMDYFDRRHFEDRCH